jgi:hypothetical protein
LFLNVWFYRYTYLTIIQALSLMLQSSGLTMIEHFMWGRSSITGLHTSPSCVLICVCHVPDQQQMKKLNKIQVLRFVSFWVLIIYEIIEFDIFLSTRWWQMYPMGISLLLSSVASVSLLLRSIWCFFFFQFEQCWKSFKAHQS